MHEHTGGNTDSKYKKIDILWRWDGEQGRHILLSVPRKRSLELLNPVGALIFVLCDGLHSVEQITAAVCEAFSGADPQRARRDVRGFIDYLGNLGLIHET